MIPPFTPEGLLPPTDHGEPYACTRDEIEQRFVIERGSPQWRVTLFDGWDLVSVAVADLVPGATWWLWGCFVSAHEDPLFGDAESLSALVLLPVASMPASPGQRAVLVDFLHAAEQNYRVDVRIVFEYEREHPSYVDVTQEALEFRWRPSASLGVADHTTKELVPAGFVKVRR